MSEVKLLVDDSHMVFDTIFLRDMLVVKHRPATTAEIMASHPDCSQCKFMYNVRDEFVNYWECDNDNSPCFGRSVNPTTDYCRHWEQK